MRAVITMEVEVSERGTPVLPPVVGARLQAKVHGSSFHITGNSEGLLLMARALLGLAKMPESKAKEGFHIHLDELYNINDDGIEILLARE